VSLPILKIAVVGHTNTGKTSLLRTLTRDAKFGEVSNRPATTRHVEGTSLLVNGVPLIELYDTPGLEDSIGLLEFLDSLHGGGRIYGIELITRFLDSPAAHDEFEQEAKALRQVLTSDISLYVIDVRDRVLGKHRDELEILANCTKPVVPVLNFIASPEAKTAQWREHLARVNIHAVVEFDTVVLDEYGERRLFEKMQTLLDHFYHTLQAVIEDRQRQRARLNHASADLLADLLIDVAAYKVTIPLDTRNTDAAMESLRQLVCDREQQCVDALLELYRFHLDDYAIEALPIEDGQWGMDLFNPASMKQFGIRAGGGAAAGGMAGLAVDAMTGGATLGSGAAIGAAIGALWSSSRTHGKRLADRVRGFTELRVNDETLRLLAVRQIELVQALLRRGHASRDKIRLHSKDVSKKAWMRLRLPAVLEKCQVNPAWSRLNKSEPTTLGSDTSRFSAKDELARIIEVSFSESMIDSAST
jgi:GTPase Era involved in 16S rRNA processing